MMTPISELSAHDHHCACRSGRTIGQLTVERITEEVDEHPSEAEIVPMTVPMAVAVLRCRCVLLGVIMSTRMSMGMSMSRIATWLHRSRHARIRMSVTVIVSDIDLVALWLADFELVCVVPPLTVRQDVFRTARVEGAVFRAPWSRCAIRTRSSQAGAGLRDGRLLVRAEEGLAPAGESADVGGVTRPSGAWEVSMRVSGSVLRSQYVSMWGRES